MEDLNALSRQLDELLSRSDISETTAEGFGSNDLPDGYYLCEVEKAELTSSKNSGNPMVKLQYKVVENGLKNMIDSDGNDVLVDAKGTANRKVFMNYVLSNEQQVNFFVSDMLKFSDPEDLTTSLLQKDDFKSTNGILTVLDILQTGLRIYIMVQSKANKDDPTKMDKKYNPITWKRVKELGLPM